MKRLASLLLLATAAGLPAIAQAATLFAPGNLIVSVEGNGVWGASSGAYTDNQAAPLTLFGFTHNGASSASYAGALVLPQANRGANSVISGEYGSSSEGALQLTGDGKHLTIMGYGVGASAFNADPTAYGTTTNDPSKPNALGQSGSLTGQGYTAVPRIVALIGADGLVDTTTKLDNIFNGNNPRSVYSQDGSSFYVSGQGNSPDATGGVFYAQHGATSATPITGLDTNGKSSAQDTRFVTAHDGQLYVSVDSKEGSGNNRDFIGTLGAPGALPTTLANLGAGPTRIAGYGNSGGTGKFTLNAQTSNGVNAPGKEINLSPESYFFASDTVLYVADSGVPKNDSVSNDSASIRSSLGDGGLQKWVFTGGAWTLEYTLADGLGLVANSAASGTTGLLGLTGQVINGQVELFATNYTIGDTDPTYLFGISDPLGALTRTVGEQFTMLAAAPANSTFKGVAFAPSAIPEPASWSLMIAGFGMLGAVVRRRRPRVASRWA